MVEEAPELPVNPEASQSLFDISQSILQSPPEEIIHKKPISKKMMAGLTFIFILVVLSLYLVVFGSKPQIEEAQQVAVPSPTPVVKVDAKEKELKRVEKIVEQANPEDLLILPPQVDMEIEF